MKTNHYKLETSPGDNFHTVAERASQIAASLKKTVVFEFNDIECFVAAGTNLELLWRDYSNSHLMEWRAIGPVCTEQYPADVEAELQRRTKERHEKRVKERVEQDKKDNVEREYFLKITDGVQIDLIDREQWESWKAKNTDPYGQGIFEYAESWAKLMQKEISEGKTLTDIAEHTSFQLGFMGITGFMYGAAVNILSNCWIHGETLRVWHNAKYKHHGDGVVNPAILTIK